MSDEPKTFTCDWELAGRLLMVAHIGVGQIAKGENDIKAIKQAVDTVYDFKQQLIEQK